MNRVGHRPWGVLALSLALGALGVICVVSGMTLLAWRIARPQDAVIIPPGLAGTPIDTPTPGILGTPLPIPPRPESDLPLAILPVSERPTPTPEQPLSESPTSTAPDHEKTTAVTTQPLTLSHPTASPIAFTLSPVKPTATTSPTPILAATPEPLATLQVTTIDAPSVPTRIRIERIALDAPVVPVGQHALSVEGKLYSQWDVPPTRAVGWHQTSAPLGQVGNTVLNGHHNVYGEIFRYLNVLEPGDIIALEGGSRQRRYLYMVAQTMTLPEEGQPIDVRQENARWILPTNDERVTLVTCWPYFSNTHRLVVVALPLWEIIPPAEIP